MLQHSDFIEKSLKITSKNDIRPYFERLKNNPPQDLEGLKKYIQNYSDVLSVFRENHAHTYIAMTCDTASPEKLKAFENFNTEIYPEFQRQCFEVDKIITRNPTYVNLPAERYQEFKKQIERDLKLHHDENVELEAKLSKLDSEYNQIVGAFTAEWDGKELPLPQVEIHLKNKNRAVREKAWRSLQKIHLENKTKLDNLFDRMLPLRQKIAQNAGYPNFRDYKHDELHRFDYTPQDVLQFHDSIQTAVVPLITEIQKRKIKAVGLEGDFRPWDTGAPYPQDDQLHPFQNGDELLQKTILIFEKLRPQFAQNLRRMNQAKLFDLDSRKNKAPGGYNYTLEVTGMPFIFMNAAGSQRDVETLMHEGGHAMQTFAASQEPLVFYRNYPSETAETASMTMELFTSDLWREFYDDKNLKQARREHLEGIIGIFTWCAVVDKFQHWIYTNSKHSAAERDACFAKLLDEFGTGLVNWSGLEEHKGNRWQTQMHIFEVPFYYIEYAIAQLGALQNYRNFKMNPQKALDDYVAGLKLGCTKPVPEVWRAMNIRFDFSKKTLEELMGFLKEELKNL